MLAIVGVTFNLLLALSVAVVLTIIGPMMHPKKEETVAADPTQIEESGWSYHPSPSPAR